MPKINICFEIKENPWGGANQFLKALRNYFVSKDVYEENPEEADVVLFNSHHNLGKVFKLKKRFPRKIFIHRVDGPITLTRGRDTGVDKLIFKTNDVIADATIFQSKWSREEGYKLGMPHKRFEVQIINAPDPKLFNKENRIKFEGGRKIKLITSSWSAITQKGFNIFQYLDENLDFKKYEMSFAGNSPLKFKNIRNLGVISSEDLAGILKQQDIFIAASINDPCSNSLLEALHCGLPAVFKNSGGHPELVRGAGEIFEDEKEIIPAIGRVVNNYNLYQSKIDSPKMEEVGAKYLSFAENIYNNFQSGAYKPKEINLKDIIYFNFLKAGLLLKRIIS